MDKPFEPQHKTVLDSLLLNIPGVVAGKMFGYPAYYVSKRLFACVYGEGVGVKVPEILAQELLTRRDVVPFQPLGKKKMKEWVQINHAKSLDYIKDVDIFLSSIDFVKQIKNITEPLPIA